MNLRHKKKENRIENFHHSKKNNLKILTLKMKFGKSKYLCSIINKETLKINCENNR